jgi:hypothetical protein
MSTKLWQAEELCSDGSTRNRTTREFEASWSIGAVRGHFWNTLNWCRGPVGFSAYVNVTEVAPEDRLPDVNLIGIRGDMCARDAGERP